MAKTIIIETPTTAVELDNLSNEFNSMRQSARKRAIVTMLEGMTCEHGHIVIEGKVFHFNGEKLTRNYEENQCYWCNVVKPELTPETITYTIVERDEQGKSPFYARVFVPGQEVQDFDPIRHDAHWMHTKSDLVMAVNKTFKGAWYLKPETFDARVAEMTKPAIEDITPEQLAEIMPFAQEYAEHKQADRETFEAESRLETIQPQEQERQVVRVEKKSDFSMCGTSWFYSHPECYNPVACSRDRVDVATLSHREVGSRAVCVDCGGSIHETPERVQQKPDTAYRHSWDGSHYFYYHRQCVEHRIPEEVTFEQIPLASVPQEAQCEYCYGGMHQPIQYQIEIQHQEMKPTPKPRKKGRPSQDKMIRHYTIDREVAEFIDGLPDGERSRFVNSLLKQGVENARRTNP